MMEVQKSPVKPDAWNMPQILMQQADRDISMDDATRGVSAEA